MGYCGGGGLSGSSSMGGYASEGCVLIISSGKGLLGLYTMLFSISALLMLAISDYAYNDYNMIYLSSATWYLQLPRFSDKSGQSVLAALNQSSIPGVPATFQDAIDSGHVRESMQVGTCPRWTSR